MHIYNNILDIGVYTVKEKFRIGDLHGKEKPDFWRFIKITAASSDLWAPAKTVS